MELTAKIFPAAGLLQGRSASLLHADAANEGDWQEATFIRTRDVLVFPDPSGATCCESHDPKR